MIIHILVALFSGSAAVQCYRVGRRPGLRAWLWFALASGLVAASHVIGTIHTVTNRSSGRLISLVELLAFVGLVGFVCGAVRMLAIHSGGERSIETRIDGWLAGLAAANIATEFLLLPTSQRLDFSSTQQAAFFAIQLVLILLMVVLAGGIVWQPTGDAKVSFAFLLAAAAVQTGTFNWTASDLQHEFSTGNDKILIAFFVYGMVALAAWFAERARGRRVELPSRLARWSGRGIGVPALCVVVQLGIVARIALGRSVDWPAILLLFVSFFVIAYRLNVTDSLGQRLSERTRERDRMAALVAMSRALTEAGDLTHVVATLSSAAAQMVNATDARIALADQTGVAFRWFDGLRESNDVPNEAYASLLTAQIGLRTEPFTLSAADPSIHNALAERWREHRRANTLIVPLWDDGALLGLVEIWRESSGWIFSREDVDVMAAMSREASLAIRHVNALESARRSAHDRALILRVSQAASSVLGLTSVAYEIAENSLGVAGAESCAIEHWLPESEEFEVIADRSTRDWPGDEMTGTRHRGDSNPIYAYAFKHSAPLLIRRGDPEAEDPKLSELMDLWEIGSAITYPLWAEGQLIGLLEFFSRRVDAFDAAAIRLGEQIAAQASLAIRHSHMLTVAKRNADERAILLRVSQAATSSSSMREMLGQIAAAAMDVPNVETCSVRLWQREAHILERVAGVAVPDWGLLDMVDPKLDLTAMPAAYDSLIQRHSVLLDPDNDVYKLRCAEFERFGIGTMFIVPLWLGDVCAGELIFASRERGAFDANVQRLGQEIGQLTAVAIQQARAHDEVRQLADEQAAMLRVSRLIGLSLDQREVFGEITAAGLTLPGFEACQLELWRRETNQLEIAGTSHIPEWWEGSPTGTLLPADAWPMTLQVIASREPLMFERDSPFLTDYERDVLFIKDKTGSGLIVPIVSGAECFGVLTFYSRSVHAFNQRHIRLGVSLANQAALAIERARVHAALEEQALTDGLTGLWNHRALQERLEVEVARAKRDKKPVAVLMIDIDSFKEINDSFGHVTGDQILREVAGTLRRSVRATDHVGRYGGDEFLILLPGADASEALTTAERMIRNAALTEVQVGPTSVRIQLSVGFAVFPNDAIDPPSLIAKADRSMYSAKHTVGSGLRSISDGVTLMPLRGRRSGEIEADLETQALNRRRPL